MKQFTRGAVVLATIPLLLLGFASAALAGGSARGSGVSTMRPVDDGGWSPAGTQPGVTTMRPFDDPNWTPSGTHSGVTTMRPVDDVNWTPAGTHSGVTSMRPFDDVNWTPVGTQPAAPVAQPGGSPIPPVALLIGLTALAAAAAAWLTIGRRNRLRPA